MERKKILLVEDASTISKLTKFRLENSGFEVMIAVDGQAALEAIETSCPDIILLDYGLPGMDGAELVKEIKSHERHNSIPIIMFTASLENLKRVKELGIEEGILKPYESKELLEKIKKILGATQT